MIEASLSTVNVNIEPSELPPDSLSGGPESNLLPDGMWPSYCNPNYVMPNEIDVYVESIEGNTVFFMLTYSLSSLCTQPQ